MSVGRAAISDGSLALRARRPMSALMSLSLIRVVRASDPSAWFTVAMTPRRRSLIRFSSRSSSALRIALSSSLSFAIRRWTRRYALWMRIAASSALESEPGVSMVDGTAAAATRVAFVRVSFGQEVSRLPSRTFSCAIFFFV